MSDEQKIPEALRELYGEACAKVKGHRMYPHPWGQVCDLIERIARSEQALAALEARNGELEASLNAAILTIDGYYQGVCCCDNRHACEFCKEADKFILATRAALKGA